MSSAKPNQPENEISAIDQPTPAGAVELQEDELDQAAGGRRAVGGLKSSGEPKQLAGGVYFKEVILTGDS